MGSAAGDLEQLGERRRRWFVHAANRLEVGSLEQAGVGGRVRVVLAETFVAMPFLIITVEGALRSADQGFEEAAATLGAKRMTVFSRVTVPMVAPSLGAGAVLCWARALGEFGATITFAGSFPGQTETMPIAVYYALETDPNAAIALSLVLLVVSVVVLVSLRERWLRGGSIS